MPQKGQNQGEAIMIFTIFLPRFAGENRLLALISVAGSLTQGN